MTKQLLDLFLANALHGLQAGKLVFGSVEISGGPAPSEFQLLKCGHWDAYPHPKLGIISFTIEPLHIAAAIDYNQLRRQRNPNRDLVIDYDHKTMRAGDPRAAGWMNIARKGDEVWATDVRWTKAAKEAIEAGEYRYISPVFAFDVLDKVTAQQYPMGVFQAGLTNEPFFDELQPLISASDNSHHLFYYAKDSSMDDLLQSLRYFLGLPLTATPEEIATQLTKLASQVKEAISAETVQAATLPALLSHLNTISQERTTFSASYNEVLTTLALPASASIGEVKGLIAANKTSGQSVQELQTRLNAIETERFTERFNGIMASALTAGRVSPAQMQNADWLNQQKDWAKGNFDSFSNYFTASAPIVVPVKGVQVDNPSGTIDPQVIAASAQAYIDEQSKLGRTVSVTEAVNHVKKGR